MGIGKYKYYFAKPKSEITKDIFSWLLTGGAICLAATSPYFVSNLLGSYKTWRKYPRKKVSNTFYHLRKGGFLNIERKNHQVYISLTEAGRKKAGMFQIDSLKIKRPKKWDGKWRIIIFDIAQLKRMYRDALRGKLKELDFYKLQKSVWVCPFDCRAEIELLRDFFGLGEDELRLVVTSDIGGDDRLKKLFKLTS
jgi:hypothetical protein